MSGFKGARNAPSGHKIRDTVAAIRMRAPINAGNFAVWGLMFSVFDCTFAYVRRKEDSINPIAAGFATGFSLAIRGPSPRLFVCMLVSLYCMGVCGTACERACQLGV